jgi:hypothetical protein
MTHNFEEQRRETFETFAQATTDRVKLPATAVVEFIFIIEEMDAKWAAFEKSLHAKGFRTRREPDGETMIVIRGPMPITAEAIWAQEKLATEIALAYDFYPDGWDLGEEDGR